MSECVVTRRHSYNCDRGGEIPEERGAPTSDPSVRRVADITARSSIRRQWDACRRGMRGPSHLERLREGGVLLRGGAHGQGALLGRPGAAGLEQTARVLERALPAAADGGSDGRQGGGDDGGHDIYRRDVSLAAAGRCAASVDEGRTRAAR